MSVTADEINRVGVMQLASASDGQPWVCSVYFVVKGGNFYWLSFPERRHSKELAHNQKAAVAITIHTESPVVGLQAEGDVRIVRDIAEASGVLDLYVKKYGKGEAFIERLKRGENRHELYCFMPRKIMLFDERTQNTPSYRQISLAG